MRTLFVTPNLEYGGQAKQLTLLATHLPRTKFDARVCVLGREGPLGRTIRAADIPVVALEWTRPVDARPLLRLRQLVGDFRPDVIHAWGFPALRACALVSRGSRLAFAAPSIPQSHRWRPNPLDSWLLRRVDLITVSERHAVAAYARFRGTGAGVQYASPCVEESRVKISRSALLKSLKLPPDARLIICVGPLSQPDGHRNAIWALDILKYMHDDLFLVLVGDGTQRRRLEEFAESIRVTDRVRFAGAQSDVGAWLELADVVWVPSAVAGGAHVALESMAAARPVVATRVPALAEIVVNGETGYLVNVADKVGLARQTHMLLGDADLRTKFGTAGEQRALEHFTTSVAATRCEKAYMGVAA